MKDGKLWTTSLNIARSFAKEHKHVMRDIQAILGTSGDRGQSNFRPISWRDAYDREQPMYEISRDGFAFLVFGFTGHKADQVKWRYIDLFNQYEQDSSELKQMKESALNIAKRTPEFSGVLLAKRTEQGTTHV